MKILVKNIRASFDYDIKETFDAGLVLTGAEVKSCKLGHIQMQGSYVNIEPSGGKLKNCHISKYPFSSIADYDPVRERKLLLTKQEISRLIGKEKGLVLIPLELFVGRGGRVKLRIGLGRSRKKTDKREFIKKREIEKEIRKSLD